MSEAIIPKHIGLILDGNRRWAKEQGLPVFEGHRQGAEVFKSLTLHAFERGVQYVTGYVFSTENWKRTEEEVGYLMGLVTKAVENYLDTFQREGIKIVILGRRDGLRKKVLKAIQSAEEATKDNTKGTLALCFNYGGKEEIVDAVKHIIDSGVDTDEVTPQLISENLYAPDAPPLDLIIRTSGEQRLSGFMLWQSCYAELYFVNKLWPNFTVADLDGAIDCYCGRERRFGS